MYLNKECECECEKWEEKDDFAFPPQHQDRQPGFEYVMKPIPTSECGRQYKIGRASCRERVCQYV